jgi:glycosyltransferase involved in cell wall biosynthesis
MKEISPERAIHSSVTPPSEHARSSAHVVHTLTRLCFGGATPHVLSATRDLQALGFRVEIAAGRVGANEGAHAVTEVPHIDIPRLKREISPANDLASFRELVNVYRNDRPDIVHTHQAKAGLLARLAAKRAGVPVIVHTFHGHVLNNYFSAPVSHAFAATERRLSRITDACIAVSSSVRDDLLGRGVGTRSKWHVIPIGLDQVDLLEDMPDARLARKNLGLPLHGPVVGSVGRLVPIKDLDTFIDAAALVRDQRPDVHFVIAGDGDLRSRIELRARSILGDGVSVLGWVSDLKELYAALDIVVLTSLAEGTPAALIEAGAAGKPVVATDVGGVSDVVVHDVTGLLVEGARDPRAVARRVLELLDDHERSRKMGASGREIVRARFSQERMVRELRDLYESLQAEKTGR